MPRRPKDRAKVEVGVQTVERSVLAKLRNRRFTSLATLNQAIFQLVGELNRKPSRCVTPRAFPSRPSGREPSSIPATATTHHDPQPYAKRHRRYAGWTHERLQTEAKSIGELGFVPLSKTDAELLS